MSNFYRISGLILRPILSLICALGLGLGMVATSLDAAAQAQRSGDSAAKGASEKSTPDAAKKQKPGNASKQAAKPAGDGKAADAPSAARREAKPQRRGKAKKPRAFEETPAPRHTGPTMMAGAAVGAVALGGAGVVAGRPATVEGGAAAKAAGLPAGAGAMDDARTPVVSKASEVASAQVAAPRPSLGEAIGLKRSYDPLALQSSVALVVDARSGDVLVGKNPAAVLPIASITKLMTAMVVLDAGLPLGERLQISRDDIDRMRHTSSRLHPGARLTRGELLQLALMASENRAANALGRHYPGGMPAFVNAMNSKARSLGMNDSRFVEPTGLSSDNVASARDLARMVRAAAGYPAIRQYSTARSLTVQPAREPLGFYNTNRLVSTAGWSIGLQKTGYISEAGNCLVMLANVEGRQTIFVLLDAAGKLARFGDAQRIRGWLEKGVDSRDSARGRAAPSAPTASPSVAPLRVAHEQR